ncbi:MAG: hypothetical protein PHV39_03090, partial [Methanomicrobium sp.]|nr:hypothetical protein [Methanomicrobium sp.]
VEAVEHKEPVKPEAASGSVTDLGAESKSVALGPAGSSDNVKKAEGIIDTDEYSEELEDFYEKNDNK